MCGIGIYWSGYEPSISIGKIVELPGPPRRPSLAPALQKMGGMFELMDEGCEIETILATHILKLS